MNAERIDTALHARSWTLNRAGREPARDVVLLLDGKGEVEGPGARLPLEGPCIAWLGSMTVSRLRVEAGGAGLRASIDAAGLVAAIGDQPESGSLAALADRDFVLSLAGQEERSGTIERCLAALAAEQRQAMAGSALLASALLRIVLVTLLRISGGVGEAAPSGGGRTALLQRFRQLVEMNFRGHWPIARYCEALAVTPDRLHAVCTAGLGKSPKALVSERLAHEAAMRLERSSLTVGQLGHVLGFSDPAHFSAFFRRMRGMPPGRYRTMVAASRIEGRREPSSSFADWP